MKENERASMAENDKYWLQFLGLLILYDIVYSWIHS